MPQRQGVAQTSGIIKEMLIMEEREAVKIFLPYIFLSLHS